MTNVAEEKNATYVLFSPDLLRLLHENGVRIEDVLERAGATGFQPAADPAAPTGARGDLTVFIGAAALVASSTPLIVQALRALLNRPVVHVERECVPALDEGGEVRRNADGSVIYQWRERPLLLTPSVGQISGPAVTVKALGAEIRVE